jgi:hypothetical protein
MRRTVFALLVAALASNLGAEHAWISMRLHQFRYASRIPG